MLTSDTSYAKSLLEHPHSDHSSAVAIISNLDLKAYPEGGLFAETDRNSKFMVPNPYANEGRQRYASSSIHYLLSLSSPIGAFHRNKSRTIHTLHKGRGRYVIIHADGVDSEPGKSKTPVRVETFEVGQDVAAGERLQWVVEGGKYKASFLLPEKNGNVKHEDSDEGLLLISETVVPGFEFADHDFLREKYLARLVGDDQAEELRWLLRKSRDWKKI